jgi:hypothetical protein
VVRSLSGSCSTMIRSQSSLQRSLVSFRKVVTSKTRQLASVTILYDMSSVGGTSRPLRGNSEIENPTQVVRKQLCRQMTWRPKIILQQELGYTRSISGVRGRRVKFATQPHKSLGGTETLLACAPQFRRANTGIPVFHAAGTVSSVKCLRALQLQWLPQRISRNSSAPWMTG